MSSSFRSSSDALRSAGLRRTPARRAVLDLPQGRERLATHAERAQALGDVDDITLYRTLATLVEKGLVHRVHGIDGVWRYGANAPRARGALATTCEAARG